ncbi:MAG TPA: hypothetical protein VEB20_23745 [Azospirillaceae bacterium]|nr:hypothetical protein [Azospirillaceae bacterium]
MIPARKLSRWPEARPSFRVPFTLVDNLPAGATFTRADAVTCATRVNRSGVAQVRAANVPRFTHRHDAATDAWEADGYLSEESRTNHIRHSDLQAYALGTTPANFSGAAVGVPVVSNAVAAPYGDRVLRHQYAGSGDNNVGAQGNGVLTGLPAGATVVFSCQVHIPSDFTGTLPGLSLESNVGANTIVEAADTAIRGRWQRISVRATLNPGATATAAVMRCPSTSVFYSACWMVEVASIPGSFIPTAASVLTRAADALSWAAPAPSQAVGADKVTNGNFSADGTAAGWSPNGDANALTVSGGEMVVTAKNNGTTYPTGIQNFTTVAGQEYVATVTMRKGTGTNVFFNVYNGGTLLTNSGAVTATSSTTVIRPFVAASTSTGVFLGAETTASGQTGFFDSASVKPNKVTNGTFASDTAWTKGAGWTISGGKAHKAAGSGTTLSQTSFTLVAGRAYRIAYTLSNRTAGQTQVYVGDTGGALRNANGTYTETLVATTTTGGIVFGTTADFAGSISDVALVDLTTGEMLTNGEFNPNGWAPASGVNGSLSLVAGKLRVTCTVTGQGGCAGQALSGLTVGRSYRVTFDADTAGSGYVYVDVHNGSSALGFKTQAASGTALTFDFVATGTSANLRLFTSATAGAYTDFDNVTVYELTAATNPVGPELAANGTFSSITGWTLGTGWSHDAGNAEVDATAAVSGQTLACVLTNLVVGQVYRASMTIRNHAGGTVALGSGASTAIAAVGADGTFTGFFIATATSQSLYVNPQSTFTGTIGNVSVMLASPFPWLNPAEGTVYIEFVVPALTGANNAFLQIDDGTGNNRIIINQQTNNSVSTLAVIGGSATTLANPLGATISAGTVQRVALAYKGGSYASCRNGGTPTASSLASVPTGLSALRIGCYHNTTAGSATIIADVAYFPFRLSDAELRRLTAHGPGSLA